MSDADDRGLLGGIAARDKSAFETFFRTHGSGVHRFVRDLVRDDGLAEELTSDVMVEVWRNAGKYGGRSRARTWVFGIAHHKAIDALRKRRGAPAPLADPLGPPGNPVGPVETGLGRAGRATGPPPKKRRGAPTLPAGPTRRWPG